MEIFGFMRPKQIEVKSPEDWQNWLMKTMPDFKGDYVKAGVLLNAYSEGSQWVVDKLGSQGLNFKKPEIKLFEQEDAAGLFMYRGKICVDPDFLEKYSKRDLYKEVAFNSPDGKEIAYKGNLIDLFRLAGVEETHHSIYLKTGKLDTDEVLSLQSSIADYFSTNHEYMALRWQIRYARERNMPENTINILEKHLNTAIEKRRK